MLGGTEATFFLFFKFLGKMKIRKSFTPFNHLTDCNNPEWGPLANILSYFKYNVRMNTFSIVSKMFNHVCWVMLNGIGVILKKELLVRIPSDRMSEFLDKKIISNYHEEIFDLGLSTFNISIVKQLLQSGKVSVVMKNLAINYAITENRVDFIELFLSSKFVTPHVIMKSVYIAFKAHFYKVLILLLNCNNIQDYVWYYLIKAECNSNLCGIHQKELHMFTVIIKQKNLLLPKWIWTPLLSRSCTLGCVKFVKLFMSDKKRDPSFKRNKAITIATARNKINIVVELLKDKRVSPFGDSKDSAYSCACARSHVEILKLFLTDPRLNADTCLNVVCVSIKLVKVILNDERTDPNRLFVAQFRGWSVVPPSVLLVIIKHNKFDPTHNKFEAIKVASENGQSKVVFALMNDDRVNFMDHIEYVILSASRMGGH